MDEILKEYSGTQFEKMYYELDDFTRMVFTKYMEKKISSRKKRGLLVYEAWLIKELGYFEGKYMTIF